MEVQSGKQIWTESECSPRVSSPNDRDGLRTHLGRNSFLVSLMYKQIEMSAEIGELRRGIGRIAVAVRQAVEGESKMLFTGTYRHYAGKAIGQLFVL
jgi:hypothetical protein